MRLYTVKAYSINPDSTEVCFATKNFSTEKNRDKWIDDNIEYRKKLDDDSRLVLYVSQNWVQESLKEVII
ncbi:hypothetical protein UFOVP263_26 [uncultured Caudovirales phage]|uniref:Uncharacterized protein n=1 Tax=uncultured Caudovirales phage TaxID=2100421 RepID=A0A6J5LGQ1_9CAUD|nr:hypothetical protein UFOVP263_26 [uncultured Caudovirales phage]CAB4242077.1 hypothetical protein UFOVP91_37 [uncultured Caudovirales phage]